MNWFRPITLLSYSIANKSVTFYDKFVFHSKFFEDDSIICRNLLEWNKITLWKVITELFYYNTPQPGKKKIQYNTFCNYNFQNKK